MRLLFLVVFLFSLHSIEMQCWNSFGGGNGYYSGGNGGNGLSNYQQPQPQYQQTSAAAPSPSFKWRRRALRRRVKRAKRAAIQENSCPMDFLQGTVNEGMTGDPPSSMTKIYSFLTYMGREDLGTLCSLSKIHVETFSHGYCLQKNNSTGESCLVFEI